MALYTWDLSSAGRASALQAEGHRFEPYRSHLLLIFFRRIEYMPMWIQFMIIVECDKTIVGRAN